MRKKMYKIFCYAEVGEEVAKAKLITNVSLRKMGTEDLQEMMEHFAEDDSRWNSVLEGKGNAGFLDEETWEAILYVDGNYKWILRK